MARKTMTKEVTYTQVKVAKMDIQDGQPVAQELPDETMIGNVSMEKATKQLSKKYGQPVTVFEVNPQTEKYQMSVEDFIEHADKIEE